MPAELVGDDLEPEDAPVELGGPRSVADEQDGVVEPRDGDAHRHSVRHGSKSRRHAAIGAATGAPTSFQPDCQLPPLAMLSVMFRKARPSSWRARRSGPTSIGSRPIERDELEHGRLRVGVVGGDVAVELDALGDRVALVRGEQRVERLDDPRLRQERG